MENTRVTTGKIRLSYLQVFEAKAMAEGETPKFSAAILLNKLDKATKEKCDAAIQSAITQGISKKWKGKKPAILKLPWRDGSEEKPDDEAYNGHWFLNASNTKKPILLGTDKRPLEDPSELYSGVYARAVLTFYPFSGKSNGVAVSLDSIMKLEDGESLGGSLSLADAVSAFDEDDDLM